MPIRNFHPGDEPALRAVFYSSVHDLARHHYTAEQLAVWAPRQYDAAQWGERMRGKRPFIAEVDGCIAGFADLQDSGYVDHFFVAEPFCTKWGVGVEARQRHIFIMCALLCQSTPTPPDTPAAGRSALAGWSSSDGLLASMGASSSAAQLPGCGAAR